MAKSPFYARIKRDVLTIMRSVPEGQVVTFAAIGSHLDIVPRHPAYILAMLDGPERDGTPWHRAVAADGVVDRPAQREKLEAEGFAFDPDGRIAGFEARVAEVAGLPHGVPKQTRPANAPLPRGPARPRVAPRGRSGRLD